MRAACRVCCRLSSREGGQRARRRRLAPDYTIDIHILSHGDAVSQSYKDAQAYTAPVYVHILRKPGYLIASIQQVKGRRTMRVTSR